MRSAGCCRNAARERRNGEADGGSPGQRAAIDGHVHVSIVLARKRNARLLEESLVAGVDEAGRGPLAGPVVVAAVIHDPAARRIRGIDDSKLLSPDERERLHARILERALAVHVSVVEVEEIDRINIYHATMAGMSRALCGLRPAPLRAFIDGNRLPPQLPCPAEAVVGGDGCITAIGAASIVAKVTRDRIMVDMDALHPGYGFAQHKGYSTPEHLEALRRLGPCVQHRRSFQPVREQLQPALFAD